MKAMSTEIIVSCDSKYYGLAPLFIYFARASNPKHEISIVVDDLSSFSSFLGSELVARLQTLCNGLNFFERPKSLRRLSMDRVRFLYPPSGEADYIYFSDIDVFLSEDVEALHISIMSETGLPFSNIRREGARRLSGLHFQRRSDYLALLNDFSESTSTLSRWSDERILFEIIQSGFENNLDTFVPTEARFRPVPGIHASIFSRSPYRAEGSDKIRPGWSASQVAKQFFMRESESSEELHNLLGHCPTQTKGIFHLVLSWLELDNNIGRDIFCFGSKKW